MSPRLLAILLLVSSSPLIAQPQHFKTTLHLQDPVVNSTAIDTVIFRWSTFEVAGSVFDDELYNLTMEVLIGTDSRYSDAVVVGGVPQLFDGMVREPEIGYFWEFDLDSGLLEQFVNVTQELVVMSTGEHYALNDSVSLSVDSVVDVVHYVDGVTVDGASDFLDVQTTEPMLFFDGFEGGDALQWSATVGWLPVPLEAGVDLD